MGAATKALEYLVLDPIKKGRPALLPLRLSQILHDRTAGRSDVHFQRIMKPFRAPVSLGKSKMMEESAIAASAAKLEQKGWDILPFKLDPADIEALRNFAFSSPAYAKDPRERIMIDRNNIPHDHGRYMWPMSDFIRVPAVQKILSESAFHEIAQRYLKCRPILTSASMWLDPVYQGKFEPHVYHYDNDGPGFLKFFIYLSDVDIDSGAHTFIEGSHRRNKPKEFTRARRYDRQELLDHYGAKSEIVFEAPAGTIIAEDTSGFHKGTTLKKDYRLLMQLQYAILDIPHEEEFNATIAKVRVDGVPAGARRILQKFVA